MTINREQRINVTNDPPYLLVIEISSSVISTTFPHASLTQGIALFTFSLSVHATAWSFHSRFACAVDQCEYNMPGGTYALHSRQAQCFVSTMCAVRVAMSGTSASHISHRGGAFASKWFCEIFSSLVVSIVFAVCAVSPLTVLADCPPAGFESDI